ncbi:hypothetical protein [Ekhidna sp. To15]|uniref:hypothetical protein n=1 Tax=Ekhidna sp. To15 TaxID=3395267 RepID=UPI003F51D0F9
MALLSLLIGCSFPEAKPPKFQKDTDVLVNELKSIRNFKDADITWNASSMNNATKYSLNISLYNGEISNNEEMLRTISIEAIQIVISSISNESEFDEFSVEIIQKTSGVSKSRTFIFLPSDVGITS